MSILDDINPLNPKSPFYLLPGPSLTPQQQKQGPSLAPGASNLALTQQQQQTGGKAITDILNLTGIEQFAVRVLEVLVGIAFILLGLQALTGTGTGNPIAATRHVVRKVAKVAK